MRRTWLIPLLVLALVALACGPAQPVAEETTTTVAETTTTVAEEPEPEPTTDIGTAENPIKVLFVPSVEAAVIVSGGEVMRQALEEATGLHFDVSVPTSYAATIEEMCASPDNSMGFIPGLGYVLASNLCGVDVAFKAVRFGWSVYWSQILVQRDSGIESIEELDGLRWAYPDAGSTSGYMVPLLQLRQAGVTPSEEVEAGGHGGAVLAVYRGEADFGTSFFSPPLIEGGAWQFGDDPDIPDEFVDECAVTEADQLWCGPYRVLDARASVRTDAPDIVQRVKILTISPEIPNDTLSFGPDFPPELRAQIEQALLAFAQTEAWDESIGNQDFYGWTSIDPATDAEYDDLRQIVEIVGIDLQNIGG